jgi:hypothetical protein
VSRRTDLQPGGGELAAVGHPPAPGAGLEKSRFFFTKPSPVFFFFIFAQMREFLGFFSVSRILLGASRH